MRQEKTIVIPVKGMFCSHCEKRIQDALSALPGVSKAKASFEKNHVAVSFDPDMVTLSRLEESIRRAGYEVGESRVTLQIVSVLIILLAAYVIARSRGWTSWFNVFPRVETSLRLSALFATGLLTSVHCIAMCGGINLTQTTMAAQKGRSILRANLSYQAGRVLSYTAVGALAGGLGQVLSVGGRFKGLVALLAGLFMVLMALHMLGIFRPLRRLPLQLPTGLYQKAAGMTKNRSSSLMIGLLNGLMPCGPLQAVQLYALSAGSIVNGALAMLLFCLGTIPLLLGFGLFAGRLNRKYADIMLSVSACLIFVLGLHMCSNGLALSGVNIPYAAQETVTYAMQQGDTQTVRTEIDYGAYPPIHVKKGVPVEWIVFVPTGKLNGCNAEILIPAYDLDVVLREGENLICFVPEETGSFPYSCWMGMIHSVIEVTE